MPTQLPVKTVSLSQSGFRTVTKDCEIYPAPSVKARAVLKLKKGRKLWLEPFDMHWSMGFNRAGDSVFVPKQCFEAPALKTAATSAALQSH